MAIEPKTTREHILSLYGHISGVKKNLKHVHEDVEKICKKIKKDFNIQKIEYKFLNRETGLVDL